MSKSKFDNIRAVVIGTCGHIDHGKTSLVRALTGVDTDMLAEEKKRGLSIDLGFAWTTFSGGAVNAAIVDVPGHDRFIRNMLAGVSGIDIALLCVAADDGVMPQTIEHVDIVNLLGISRAIVVITKSDIADEDRIRAVSSQVRELLKGTLLEGASIMPVSIYAGNAGDTGAGLDELRSLIEGVVLDTLNANAESIERRASDLFRLPVDRSFSVKGFGTVVTGTVFSGTLTDGNEVSLYPSGRRVRVRGIESHHKKVDIVSVGERAAINLSALPKGELKRGDLLLSPSFEYSEGSLSFDCILQSLKSNSHKLKSGRVFKLYHMTSEAEVSVRLSSAASLSAGERGYARIHLRSAPLFLLRGDRFILRDPSINRTVGGGRVLLPYLLANSVDGLASALKLSEVDFDALALGKGGEEDLSLLLDGLLLKGKRIIKLGVIAFMLNIDRGELKDYLSSQGATYMLLQEDVVARSVVQRAEQVVLDTLKQYHKSRPAELGLKESALLAKAIEFSSLNKLVKAQLPILFRDGLLNRLVSRKGEALKCQGAVYSLVSHKPATEGVDKELEESILRAFGDGYLALKINDIIKSASIGAGSGDVERLLRTMVERGSVVRLKEGLYMSVEAVSTAKEKLVAYLEGNDTIKAAEFRDLLGCGRKLAIEILEYFDRENITLRNNDLRKLR